MVPKERKFDGNYFDTKIDRKIFENLSKNKRKFDFLLLTLLLVGRLDLTETSSNSSFSHRQLKVLKPDYQITILSYNAGT